MSGRLAGALIAILFGLLLIIFSGRTARQSALWIRWMRWPQDAMGIEMARYACIGIGIFFLMYGVLRLFVITPGGQIQIVR